jgi:nucleoid DNA-binding protein
MTKEELIDKIASGARLSKADAARAINATIGSITSALKKGQSVTLVGFGSFKVTKRKARKGRNPRTGEIITIKATKVPRFSAGKSLKDAVK